MNLIVRIVCPFSLNTADFCSIGRTGDLIPFRGGGLALLSLACLILRRRVVLRGKRKTESFLGGGEPGGMSLSCPAADLIRFIWF